MANKLTIDEMFGGQPRQLRTVRPAVRRTAPRNDNAPREIQVVITPDDFEHRVDRFGRPYAWVRGTLTYRKTQKTRTVMVQGESYHLIQHLLGVGTSLKISGVREAIVDKSTGKPGAEIFRARDVLKVYDAEGREIDGTTGRVLASHDRIGHYRRQHYGPGNSLVKIIWIDDCKVKGGKAA